MPMIKHGCLTCLLPNECLQIEIHKDFEGEYVWKRDEDVLLIVEKREALILHPGYLIVASQPLETEQLYSGKTIKNEQFFLFFEWINEDACTYISYNLPLTKKILIGRGDCDIRYDNAYVSNVHAEMEVKDGQLWLRDMDSRNGVYVNRKRCSKQQLQLGDCVYIMGLQMIIGVHSFALNHPHKKVTCTCSLFQKIHTKSTTMHPTLLIYPFHEQSSEFHFPSIQIQNPPTTFQQQKMPFIYTLGPSMTMGIAALTSGFFSIQNALQNQQTLTSVLPTLMMSFSMVASTMLWPILLRRYEQRRDAQHEEKRKKEYSLYLRKNQDQIQEILRQYKMYLSSQYHVDIESFISDKLHLYQYQMMKDEVLSLCLGQGSVDMRYPFASQEESLTLVEDELLQAKNMLVLQTCTLADVPIYANLYKHSLWHVKGLGKECDEYAIYLILQLCASYTSTQIQVVIAYEESESNHQYLRYLPHMFDEKQRRYLCLNSQQAKQVSMFVHQSERPTIIFSSSERLSEAMHALQLCELPHVSAFLFHNLKAHISFPHKTLQVHNNFVMDDSNNKIKWKPISKLHEVIETLTNISMPSFQGMDFPTMYSFLQMFQVESVEQLHIYTRWTGSDTSRSLAIPLGITSANEHVLLDIHEKAHGPHGIIAGMTGSGKSELLITMILSMAVNFHPDDVAFILIDYKGGGMAKALEDIPHIAGIITNLDGNMILRSLNSLDSELLRRQKIFIDTAKRLQMPSIDIYAYQRLYHQQLVEEALPHLLIIADEFAELKQQQPEFMEQLIRSARIGRSLGIHLLLATQKPSGVVDDQIWSNARFHICLKVQEKADSMDMLKRDDGAKLNDTGRFYLQVGYDELFEEGQSAYAKMPYIRDRSTHRDGVQIEQIDELGTVIAKGKKVMTTTQHIPSELELLISALTQTAQQHHIKAHQLWMPPLPKHIPLDKKKKGMLALVDDPIQQRQFSLQVALDTITHMLLFAMNLQESLMLVKTIFYHLCMQVSTSELRILFFDFAPIRFQEGSQLPHVYAYVHGDEEEDIKFLKSYIEQELQERKTYRKQQHLLICIHHLVAFLEAYEDWEELLHRLARDGKQYGITVILTATSANDVRYRLLQQIMNIFVFQLRDDSEYTTILGKSMPLLHNEGRAYWKEEYIYEVQCVDASNLIKEYVNVHQHDKAERLASLPQHIPMYSLASFFDVSQPHLLPIGIRKDIRVPYYIDLNYIWILSGSSMHHMQKTLAACSYTTDIPSVTITQFVKEDMIKIIQDKKVVLYWMHPSVLCDYACAAWLQEHRSMIRILWHGTGIETIRYLFDISTVYQEVFAQDAYVLADDIQPVRIMENI